MKKTAVLLALLLAAPTWADPPKLVIPAEVRPVNPDYAVVQPDTTAKSVTYVGQSGVAPFPSQFLADKRTFILPVRGLPAGRYRFTAVGSLNDEHAVVEFTVVLGAPPTPPVPPDPGPKPPEPIPPGPTPAPIPLAGLRVLIVYESADLGKLPAAQLAALYSAEVRAYLNAKCVKGSDGKTAEWRVWDQNVDASGEAAHWQAALKRPRKMTREVAGTLREVPTPWLILSDGKSGYEGALPANAAELLALLRKWGG